MHERAPIIDSNVVRLAGAHRNPIGGGPPFFANYRQFAFRVLHDLRRRSSQTCPFRPSFGVTCVAFGRTSIDRPTERSGKGPPTERRKRKRETRAGGRENQDIAVERTTATADLSIASLFATPAEIAQRKAAIQPRRSHTLNNK